VEHIGLPWLVVRVDAALPVTVGSVWSPLAAALTAPNQANHVVTPRPLERVPIEVCSLLGNTHDTGGECGVSGIDVAVRGWAHILGQMPPRLVARKWAKHAIN
jgi:hypothetical protein